MADYISRDAALEDFESCNAENPNWTPQRVKTLLLRQPTADVAEVVRCKGCYQSVAIGDVLHCTYWSKNTDENGYCHEGG
nr:MAG TPA: hypothetical protein [Bacteriophage sp.]